MTEYYYPTWADIIGSTFDFFENWGSRSAGNNFILKSLVECDVKNKINNNDTVMIMWSGIARLDFYQYNKWAHYIHKYPNQNEHSNCPDGYEYMTYNNIATALEYLKNKTTNVYHLSWADYDLNSRAGVLFQDYLKKVKKITFEYNRKYFKNTEKEKQEFINHWNDLYQRLSGPDWPTIEEIFNNNFNNYPDNIVKEVQENYISKINSDKEWKFRTKDNVDYHPTPKQHLDAILKYFSEFNISNETVKWVNDINFKLVNGQKYDFSPSLPNRF